MYRTALWTANHGLRLDPNASQYDYLESSRFSCMQDDLDFFNRSNGDRSASRDNVVDVVSLWTHITASSPTGLHRETVADVVSLWTHVHSFIADRSTSRDTVANVVSSPGRGDLAHGRLSRPYSTSVMHLRPTFRGISVCCLLGAVTRVERTHKRLGGRTLRGSGLGAV